LALGREGFPTMTKGQPVMHRAGPGRIESF
jgi:hypothetical protein